MVNREESNLNKFKFKVTSNISKNLNAKETQLNATLIICMKSPISDLLFDTHGFISYIEAWKVFNSCAINNFPSSKKCFMPIIAIV